MTIPKLGTGTRFKTLVKSGKTLALAAYIGIKKYGKAKMTKLATAGKKRKSN